MLTDWMPAAVLVAIITVAGTVYGIKQTRKTAKETNKVKETDLIIRTLSGQVEALTERQNKSDVKQAEATREIEDMRGQIRRLSDSEWSLKRYIRTLVEFIRSNDLDPPDPPDFTV